MSQEPGWITKAQAAAVLGVDERTIERKARARKIASKARPGFPTWYWAEDVEKLRQTGSGEVQTGVLEAGPAAPSNGHGTITSLRSFEGVLVGDVLRALRGVLTHAATGPTGPTNGPTGPTAPTLWVSVSEASAITGLTQALLRRMIDNGSLSAIRDRGWRIRRKDLEAL